LPENHECLNPFLPRRWSRYVKSALLHVSRPAPRHLPGEARLCPHVGVGRNAPKSQTLIMGQPGARIKLTVTFETGRRHLPRRHAATRGVTIRMSAQSFTAAVAVRHRHEILLRKNVVSPS